MFRLSPPVRALGLNLSCLLSAVLLLTATPASASGWNQSSAEATLWQLLNGARVNNGLAPLQSHGTLVALARWRSADMLAKDYFSHTIAGTGCLVYCWYDSNGIAYDWAGENIGWNSGLDDAQSPLRVHEAFMASPGHRANVLDPRFSYGGVGAAAADNQLFAGFVQNTRMYTELFLQPEHAVPAPASSAPVAPGGGSSSEGSAQPTAPAPATRPAPTPPPRTPLVIEMAAPVRPHSDRLDGIFERPASRFVAHMTAPRACALRARFGPE